MLSPLHPLLVVWMYLLVSNRAFPVYNNGFFYHDVMDGDGNGEIYIKRVRLHVESPQPSVSAARGSNITLPCHYRYEPEINGPRRTRVKWSWLPANGAGKTAHETDVMVAMGNRHRSYGSFQGRVRLHRAAPGDMSLVINELHQNDTGRYRCEIIDGLEDESVTVELELRGTVYFLKGPRKLNFTEAVAACTTDGGLIAKVGQLYAAWRFMGLDRCDAGWLADGSIRYPIAKARPNCGPSEPGVRNLGFPPLHQKYSVYCNR